MEEDDQAPPGLRERKKRETRDALTLALIRLSVERGWDNVTVQDVAEAANVSERTFRNYFATKADAIASRHLDRMLRVVAELRSRPPGEPLWDAITHAVTSEFAGGEPPSRQWPEGVRLMLTEPEVERGFLTAMATAQRELAAAIAERTGADAGRDLYPALVATTVGAAVGTAMEHWLRADPPVPIETLIREALGQLRAGLPTP